MIAPQTGYSRVLLNGVPVCHHEDGSLPPSDELRDELGMNHLCGDMVLFASPRWLKATVPDDARHSSVCFAFLDEGGHRMRPSLNNLSTCLAVPLAPSSLTLSPL